MYRSGFESLNFLHQKVPLFSELFDLKVARHSSPVTASYGRNFIELDIFLPRNFTWKKLNRPANRWRRLCKNHKS